MSGHSKWSTIKHQKASTDARRGQLFTKLAKGIAQAVRQGGGSNEDMNFKLRLAVQKAKDNNMPSDNIERAIKKAAGGEGQDQLEDTIYEGYGPGGVAILAECLTSNRNRTSSDVRAVFSKLGGNLGEAGCVSWNFQTKGLISLNTDPDNVEAVALLAIDGGADDVKVEEGYVEIYTSSQNLESVRDKVESSGIKVNSSEESKIPSSMVPMEGKQSYQTLKLLDSLEELEDVQKVYSNADFPDEVLEGYSNQS